MKRQQTVRVAGVPLNPDDCRTGTVKFGKSGSGKTSLIKQTLSDVLQLGDPAVVLDLSDEMTEFVKAKAPSGTPVHRVDVFHQGDGVGIEFAPVLTSTTARQRFASKVVPRTKGDPQPFFRDFARLVIENGSALCHHFAPSVWTLALCLRLVLNRKLHSAVGKLVPEIGDPYESLGNPKTAGDVHATVVTLLKPLAVYAALSERATRHISPLTVLNDGEGVMVLVWKDKYADSLEGLLSFTLDIVAEEKMAGQSNERLWIFTDELRSIQQLEAIPAIARRGRKSSICLVASMHELAGMRERYGAERAEEMLALLDRKVFLRIGSPQTAKWGSEYLGNVETLQDIAPRGDTNKGWTRTVVDRPNVTPDQLRRIPLPDARADVIRGYLDFPEITAPFSTPFLADVKAPPPARRTPVPESWERLTPMTLELLKRFNFPCPDAVLEALK